MAQILYTPFPQDTPQLRAPDDLQQFSTSPAQFGGLAAQAEQRGGNDVQQAGGDALNIAMMRQQRYNETAVQQAQNSLSDLLFAKTYKDPVTGADGIYAKKGADALAAFQPTMDAINDGQKSILDGLHNDAQRIAFETQSRYYINRERDRIGEHVAGQVDAYGVATSGATINNSIRDISANPLSDDSWNRNLQSGYGGVVTTLQNRGLETSRDAILNAKSTFESQAAVARIDALNGLSPGSGTRWAKSAAFPDGRPVWGTLPAPEQQRLGALGRQDNAASVANNEFHALTMPGGHPFTPPSLPAGISSDEDAMVRTVAGEAGKESLAGQRGVAAVIMNRARQSGSSPRDVVFAPNQFEPWNGGAARAKLEAMDPKSPEYQAILNNVVLPVVSGAAPDPTNGATHFYAPAAQSAATDGRLPIPSWAVGQAPIAVIGGHNFYKIGYEPGSVPPTTNDAPIPLSGTAVLASERHIQDSDLPPEDIDLALSKFHSQVALYNDNLRLNAENALNDLGTKILKAPLSVSDETILNDRRLNLSQKVDLRSLKQSTIDGKGDGPPYSAAVQQIFAPLGTMGRINEVSDLFPWMRSGLTAQGLEKLNGLIKLRDAPDGPVMAAAMKGWQDLIEKGERGIQSSTPATMQKYAEFVAALPGIVAAGKQAGHTMAQIVGQGGDVQKALPSFVLSGPDRTRSLLAPPASAGSVVTPTPTQGGAPQLTVGSYYTRGPGGSFVPAQPGTPTARVYRGGPVTGNPGSWEVPPAAIPSAPAN